LKPQAALRGRLYKGGNLSMTWL